MPTSDKGQSPFQVQHIFLRATLESLNPDEAMWLDADQLTTAEIYLKFKKILFESLTRKGSYDRMPISLNELTAAARRPYVKKLAKSLTEARSMEQQTGFLCHSHKDDIYAKGLQVLLQENGWDLYIDWEDCEMPEKPNRETAERIQRKIEELDWFLFLATSNSTSSKWCPWEIGYADKAKSQDKILIVVTTTDQGTWYGSEYLELYREITYGEAKDLSKKGLAVFFKGKGIWLNNL